MEVDISLILLANRSSALIVAWLRLYFFWAGYFWLAEMFDDLSVKWYILSGNMFRNSWLILTKNGSGHNYVLQP